jgi:hypothetical protein
LLCIAVVGDHVRWVLTGDGGREFADWLAEAGVSWRAWAEQVAKQLVASGVAPDGRVRSLSKDISLNWVPEGWLDADAGRRLVAQRLGTVTDWAHHRRSRGSGANAELLEVICSGFETQRQALRDMVQRAQRPNSST